MGYQLEKTGSGAFTIRDPKGKAVSYNLEGVIQGLGAKEVEKKLAGYNGSDVVGFLEKLVEEASDFSGDFEEEDIKDRKTLKCKIASGFIELPIELFEDSGEEEIKELLEDGKGIMTLPLGITIEFKDGTNIKKGTIEGIEGSGEKAVYYVDSLNGREDFEIMSKLITRVILETEIY